MSTNNNPSGIALDVRIILSALWVARMLCGLQGDSTRFHDPVALNELVAGSSEIPVTNMLLLVLSVLLSLPIIMSILSLTLKTTVNRRVNLGAGIFFVIYELFFLIFVYSHSAAYEIFWGIGYLVSAVLIVWYAWKWPKQEV
jgi:hypothetical protein